MKVFYLFIVIVSLFACRKIYQKSKPAQSSDDPDNLAAQLTGTWKLYAQTSNPENDWNGDGTPETNMYAVYTDCAKDAGFAFVGEGKGLLKKTCIDSRALNWQIKNSSNDLVYSVDANGAFGAAQTAKIIQLNERVLIISEAVQAANGKTFIINSRYFR